MDEDELMKATEELVRDAPGFTTLDDFYRDLHDRVPAREGVLS